MPKAHSLTPTIGRGTYQGVLATLEATVPVYLAEQDTGQVDGTEEDTPKFAASN